MDKDLIADYLRTKGMEAAQSDALAMIFAQMATKSDLVVLEHKFEVRFTSLEEKLDVKLGAIATNVDARFVAMEERFERKLKSMEARLTGRIIALMTLFAALVTVADRLF